MPARESLGNWFNTAIRLSVVILLLLVLLTLRGIHNDLNARSIPAGVETTAVLK